MVLTITVVLPFLAEPSFAAASCASLIAFSSRLRRSSASC